MSLRPHMWNPSCSQFTAVEEVSAEQASCIFFPAAKGTWVISGLRGYEYELLICELIAPRYRLNRARERRALTAYEQLENRCSTGGGKHLLQVIEADKFWQKEMEPDWDVVPEI